MKKNKKISIAILAVLVLFGIAGFIKAATTVGLGTADSFAVLAGSTITNTGNSVISGDLGLSPGSSVTGFPPGTVSGTQYIANATASQAQLDLTSAYVAAGQSATTVPTELGGTSKTAGVYDSADGTFGITGTLTLDAQGDPDAVFIFRTASTLITAGSSQVSLINGAQACNVFWQVGSSATLGTSSIFKGNILALTSATLTTSANVEGRVLARNGAVTLDTNIITKATCALPPPTPTPPTPTPVPATPTPAPVGNNGIGYVAPLPTPVPLINVVKVPTPLALPLGPGSVTYDYTVLNVGPVAMYNVTLADNKCPSMVFVSGDSNNNAKLDIDETWKYKCTTRLEQTTMNSVIATGQANGFTATDTAYATVVVSVPVVPPLIHLVKVPNTFALVAPGGPVTYTYTVTNPGMAPLSNVSVIDDKCTGLPGRVLGNSGDTNNNNLLDSNETWTFTCQTQLTQTTTNTGTAEGSANGLTAIDFSPATVVVAPPKLPNTGLPPAERTIPWNAVALAGIFTTAILVYATTRRKQMI